MKNFDTFGIMIDVSRNAVMNVGEVKRFLSLLKKMGYNCAMLYTEDTYEVNDEPYFGYMRAKYSKAELKELDSFALAIGMTLIPCIQTLAHLPAIFRWGNFPNDCEDILLVDDKRTYELIEHMFATVSECFTSRKIHIGMDEAKMLGRGEFFKKHGYEESTSILKRHLNRVCEIAKKYDYEVMMWSDMCFRSWNNGTYYIPECKMPQSIVGAIPKDVISVYWDYYHTEEKEYEGMIKNHKQFADKIWFAGAAWGWQGLIPCNQFTLKSMIPALNACKKHNIRNVIITLWGDDGAECSHFSQLPSLFYLAEYAKGNTDEASIKAKFKKLIGIDFDEFMQIDLPNNIVSYDGRPRNPSKNMFYSDYFNGFFDYTVKAGAGKKYISYSQALKAIAKKSRKYGYVFDAAAKLCDVLSIKYELGLRTRNAYLAGNKAELASLANNEYVQLAKSIKIYARAFEKQWMTDNKPNGFDVQEHRIGALLYRTDSCRKRILAYTSGKIDKIDELEEKLLPYGTKEESIGYNYAPLGATPNITHHRCVPV